jgi:hypothetical protein
MNLDNWTEPFKIAFKLGMFSLGWLLVLLIGSFVLAISVALLKSIPALFKGKKKLKKSSLEDTYNDAMNRLANTKNLKVVKDEE